MVSDNPPTNPAANPGDSALPPAEELEGFQSGQDEVLGKLAQNMFAALDKAVKMFNFYEGKGKNCRISVDNAYAQLTALMDKCDEYELLELGLQITPFEILLEGLPVYVTDEEKKGLTFRLFREGLRLLFFIPGLEKDEFMEILEIFRGVQPGAREDSLITRLWEMELPHFRYHAIEIFHEGITDSDLGASDEKIEDTLQLINQPLHHGSALPTGAARLDREVLNQTVTHRRELLSKVGRPIYSAPITDSPGGLSTDREDLWRRAIHIAARMVEMEKGGAEISTVLAAVLEEMLNEGRWELLGQTCEILAEGMKIGDQVENKASLDKVLTQVCAGSKLLAMQERLSECTVEEFDNLAVLLRLLPCLIDRPLTILLMRLPPGEVAERLQALLEERQVDLTEMYVDRLKSSNEELAITAVRSLQVINTSRAMAALPMALKHKNDNVRIEALKILYEPMSQGKLPQKIILDVLSSLNTDFDALREEALKAVESVPLCKFGPELLEEVAKAGDRWPGEHRRRATSLLIKWGGSEVDEYIIKKITAANLLRRTNVEEIRKELIEAARKAGARGRKLLESCMQCRMNKFTRKSVKVALETMESGRTV